MPFPFQITSLEEYHRKYQQSLADPEGFWSDIANNFLWNRHWDKVLSWDFEEYEVKWFQGGQLNISENCLDRHLKTRDSEIAFYWEQNQPTDQKTSYTYKELHAQVCMFAEILRNNGIKKGDRICIYMGMIPQLPIAMLACARLGAIHSVIFGGFSAQSISDRIHDAQASMVICCDGAFRGAKEIPLKPIVDLALESCPTVQKVIVYRRTQSPIVWNASRDLDWTEEMKLIDREKATERTAEIMEAEDPLFILYTSGSTGKPKGVVHTCGGYMVYAAYSFVNVFQYKPGQIHFCTADIGWITGHSYIVYGPLLVGACSLIFEGVPSWPDAGRFWDIVNDYKVNIFYTAPTAIRSLMSYGVDFITHKDLKSLQVLGTVGEPINEEAWHWYDDNIGKNICPIVDTWWQTETGGILISNLAGITDSKPSFATLPLPGVQPCLLDENGIEILEPHKKGALCIKFPWPSILRTTYRDHERCKQTYFSTYKGKYFTGDGAYRDENGNYRITGRMDDVLNVSGHRLGTAELENVINMHTNIIESAVVGFPHEIKGQGIYAFIICSEVPTEINILKIEILDLVVQEIGSLAKPDKIQVVKGLPKTRSGKIMRRILRKIAEGAIHELGDTSTLLDPGVVDEIITHRHK
ncbi:MAG: acetate--CoA ligase [Bacteroidota bacterium]|nr:acetate--CoA ligase [Bacteroidota bacterium]